MCNNCMTIYGDKELMEEVYKAIVKEVDDEELVIFEGFVPEDVEWDCNGTCTNDIDKSDDKYTFDFDTKWCPPYMFFREICKRFPNIKMEVYSTCEGDLVAMTGSNEDGNFIYNEVEDDDIYSDENKEKCLKRICGIKGIDLKDYDIEGFIEDEDVYYEVEDYDFGGKFENMELNFFDIDEALEILENYKNG